MIGAASMMKTCASTAAVLLQLMFTSPMSQCNAQKPTTNGPVVVITAVSVRFHSPRGVMQERLYDSHT